MDPAPAVDGQPRRHPRRGQSPPMPRAENRCSVRSVLGGLLPERRHHDADRPGPDMGPDRGPQLAHVQLAQAGRRSRSSAASRSAFSGAARWCTATDTGPSPAASTARWTRRLQGAGRRPDLLQRDDPAVLHVQHRLDGQGRPEHGGGRADPATPAKVLQGVDDEERPRRGGDLPGGCRDGGGVRTGGGGSRGGEHRETAPHGGRSRVDDGDDVLATCEAASRAASGCRSSRTGGWTPAARLPVERPPVGGDEVPGRRPGRGHRLTADRRARATSAGLMSQPSRPDGRPGRRTAGPLDAVALQELAGK